MKHFSFFMMVGDTRPQNMYFVNMVVSDLCDLSLFAQQIDGGLSFLEIDQSEDT